MGRTSLPKPVETEVLSQSKRRCCICFVLDRILEETKGQIAHLDKNPSNNSVDNLAFLCLEHHDDYDSKTSQSKNFTIGEVKLYRAKLLQHFGSADEGIAVREAQEEPPRGESQGTPYQGYVHLPHEMSAAVQRFMPDFRLPSSEDLAEDWKLFYNPTTLFPLGCSGEFIRKAVKDYAFFAFHNRLREYRIVVLSEDSTGIPILFDLETSEGTPTNRYVRTIPAGAHSVSTIVWKREGPKTLYLDRDAIEIGTFESAACIYYWLDKDARFAQQWITD